MKLSFLLLFSFFVSLRGICSSCCVANTSVPNLMILPSLWQQTLSASSSRVIGDTDTKGSSVFRHKENNESTQRLRLDLAYRWSENYHNGLALNYQNRSRALNESEAQDSGWGDLGFFQAYQLPLEGRSWLYNTINVPTSRSIYESKESFAVDAHGTGTYQTGLGIFHLKNFKSWDYILGSEVHHSFGRRFKGQSSVEVGGFWGAGLMVGTGYIPWRSKARYGVTLSPRYEGPKNIKRNGVSESSSESMVWDTGLNYTYTFSANYALGLNYIDQTIFGPARNTLLSRSLIVLLQTRWL
jgi:hypothetical protein